MPKPRKSGLPKDLGMRHDDGHFVDLIAARTAGPRIRMIPLDKIDPNPQQARSEMGDIKDLMASIKEKGILEPILVRPKLGRYEIIAGERRFMASKRLGLEDIPCIEKNVEDNEAMEIALIENLQRKDLDVFEDKGELIEKINYYLVDPVGIQKREEIRKHGLQTVQKYSRIEWAKRIIAELNNFEKG